MTPAADADARRLPWALGGILVLAAALRLASLGVTEVEWWDSTIYLTEARRIADAIPWAPPYETHRAPLLPWLAALSYGAGLGERGVYLANVLLSVGTVGLTYAAGALLFNRAAGIGLRRNRENAEERKAAGHPLSLAHDLVVRGLHQPRAGLNAERAGL